MSMFTEIYDLHVFDSSYAYREFHRKLAHALEQGWVEEIPVAIKRVHPRNERWFRDKESGEVYQLEELEGKPTSWRPVEPEELFPSRSISVGNQKVN
jgi:hypothetical protein